ncbi:MAG: serine hydrolase domain-containing protein, partial [Pseudomonadota bacterium]
MKALTCAICLALLSFASIAQITTDALETIASDLRRDTGAPAIAILVMDNGVVEAEATTGLRAISSDSPAENGDLWHLGSITKSMTATLVARLVERGETRWTLTLEEALGDEIEGMDPAFA